ncbi:MAG: acetamidase/formamidase family protein [Acidimicrobiales bacterium]
MTAHELRVDRRLHLAEEPGSGHNRWHPDIPTVLSVDDGDEVVFETRDALDGQIDEASTDVDAGKADLDVVHPLTGPVHVRGSEPGDLLEVELVEMTTDDFGFTMITPGFGFLRDEVDAPYIARWRIEGGFATSADLPGVKIGGGPFMGVIGVAPAMELVRRATRREEPLAASHPVVALPSPQGAVPAGGPEATEGLRTLPPRENGGNIDIRHLTVGSKVLLPVWVPGANLSVGDGHFAQGDGEVCGQAIEVGGRLLVRLRLRKGEAAARGIGTMCFEGVAPGGREGAYFATTGLCVRRDGTNAMEDLTVAARNAVDAMIAHLMGSYGFSRPQAHVICSVAVDLKVTQAVDVPNVSVAAFLPLGIFST